MFRQTCLLLSTTFWLRRINANYRPLTTLIALKTVMILNITILIALIVNPTKPNCTARRDKLALPAFWPIEIEVLLGRSIRCIMIISVDRDTRAVRVIRIIRVRRVFGSVEL
jgi:hypothetical protein